MIKLSPDGSPVAGRLKEARKKAGLSQKKLGELAGVDTGSASARLNQYETGKHSPDFGMLQRIAEVLNVPVEYFYTNEDNVAELLIEIHVLEHDSRQRLIEALRNKLF